MLPSCGQKANEIRQIWYNKSDEEESEIQDIEEEEEGKKKNSFSELWWVTFLHNGQPRGEKQIKGIGKKSGVGVVLPFSLLFYYQLLLLLWK